MNMGILDQVKAMFRGRLDVNQRFELLREAISGTMSEFYVESGYLLSIYESTLADQHPYWASVHSYH